MLNSDEDHRNIQNSAEKGDDDSVAQLPVRIRIFIRGFSLCVVRLIVIEDGPDRGCVEIIELTALGRENKCEHTDACKNQSDRDHDQKNRH
jgi:hypothetical protein